MLNLKFCSILLGVISICLATSLVLATEPVEPNPLPPGYVEGGGPSGFEIKDLPSSGSLKPNPDQTPTEAPDQTRCENPDGDTPPAGTPTIEAPDGPVNLIQDEGTVTSEVTLKKLIASWFSSSIGIRPAFAQSLVTQFDGGLADNIVPADASGAVNPSFVMSALNGRYLIYNRSGSLLKAPTGNQFWCNGPQVVIGCPGTNLNPGSSPFINIDPAILYDSTNGRWVTSAIGMVNNGGVLTEFCANIHSRITDFRSDWAMGSLLFSGLW
jgi:hypothetical protein